MNLIDDDTKAKAPKNKLKGDGWYLHFRQVEKQFELVYRRATNDWKHHRVPREIQTDADE